MALANRLRRLEAIREVADQADGPPAARPRHLRARRSGADRRDQAAAMVRRRSTICSRAYATQRQRTVLSRVRFKKRTVWSLAEARAALERLIGQAADWTRLDQFLISYLVEPAHGGDGVCVVLCVRAGTGARGRGRNSPAGSLRADLHAQAHRRQSASHRRMTHKKTHKEIGVHAERGQETRDCAEDRRGDAPEHGEVVETSRRDRRSVADRSSRRRAPRSCGCWKRCCSPPASRSTRRRWSRLAGRRRRQGRAGAAAGRVRDRAASISCASASKWTFRTAADLSWLLTKDTVVTRKLSRAAIETLAIVAYHQPVTRAEIEEIRGVARPPPARSTCCSKTGWIRPRGRRKAPGRPITYGTTEAFLSHFGLEEVERPAGPRRTQGRRPARRPPAGGLRACRCRPTIRRCATTRTRWSRAISTSGWRRRLSGRRSRRLRRRPGRIGAAAGENTRPPRAVPKRQLRTLARHRAVCTAATRRA